MRTLEDLAQERLKLSKQHNYDLQNLLFSQQVVISDVAMKSRLEIDSILHAQSAAGSVMLSRHQVEMAKIEMQIRQLKDTLRTRQTPHELIHSSDFRSFIFDP